MIPLPVQGSGGQKNYYKCNLLTLQSIYTIKNTVKIRPDFNLRLYFSLAAILIFAGISFSAAGKEKISKEYHLSPFTRIHLRGPFEVVIIPDSVCRMMVTAPENVFDVIDISSYGGLLSIEIEDKFFKKPKIIHLEIHIQKLRKLEIEGAVDLETRQTLYTDNLKISFEGAGHMDMEIEASKIISIIEGVGEFNLRGKTDYHKVEFSGVGSYDASELLSKYTLVESYGIGSVKVYASYEIHGEVSGVGSVDYYGDPDISEIEATGVGSVRRH